MPRPFSDDLRCRILAAYARNEGSQQELARRFGVSFAHVRKERRRLSGQMERVSQSRRGPLSRMTEAVREQLRGWLREQPDRTLAELGEQLRASGIVVSSSRISQTLQQMGLRLKRSRFTPSSGTPSKTASGGKGFLPPSRPSHRRS